MCWGHDGDDARLARPVAEFLVAGLERDEHVVFVAPDPARRTAALLGGLDEVVTSGRVALVDLADGYDTSRAPEDLVAGFVAGFVAMADEALGSGKSGLRVAADVTVPAAEAGPDFLRYELLVDVAMRSRRMTGMCIFDRTALAAPGVLDCVHPVTNGRAVPFTLLRADEGGDVDLVLSGEVDALHADHLAAGARAAVDGPVLRIDASRTTFLDHRALLALDAVERVELRTAFGGAHRLAGLVPFERPEVELVRPFAPPGRGRPAS